MFRSGRLPVMIMMMMKIMPIVLSSSIDAMDFLEVSLTKSICKIFVFNVKNFSDFTIDNF